MRKLYNSQKTSLVMGLIEEAYSQMKEMPIEFNREDIEKVLFERAIRILEIERKPKTEQNIRGKYYGYLSSIVLDLEKYEFNPDMDYTIKANEEEDQVVITKKAKWTPDIF